MGRRRSAGRRNRLLALSLAAVAISCQTLSVSSTKISSEDGTLAVIGATLIDGTGAPPLQNAVIIVQGDRIVCASSPKTCTVPAGARTLDARGRWIIPGLIDTHVHWFVWFSGDRTDTLEAAARGARTYLANGITTIVDVAGQRNQDERILRVRALVEASGFPAPRILVSGRVDSLAVNRSGARDAGELTRRLLALGVDGIKIHRGLSAADLRAVVTEARKAGRPVYGHTYEQRETGYHDYTREAVEAGVNGVFHVLGMAPVHADREPAAPPVSSSEWQTWWLFGATRWLYSDDATMNALIERMVERGAWLQPTLVTEELTANIDWYRDSPNWNYSPLPREDYATEKAGWPVFRGQDLARYRAAYARMKQFVRRFHERGGVLLAGTDGVPIHGFGLQEELRLLVEAGIPPMAALQAATRNAAGAFHWEDRVGTIERGKFADLVILNGDPLRDIGNTREIWRVVQGGVVYEREKLLNPSLNR